MIDDEHVLRIHWHLAGREPGKFSSFMQSQVSQAPVLARTLLSRKVYKLGHRSVYLEEQAISFGYPEQLAE